MIKFKAIMDSVPSLQDLDNNMFNLESKLAQNFTLFEDNKVSLDLKLTPQGQFSRRHILAKIRYKHFNIEKESNISIPIDSTLKLSENFKGYGVKDVVRSCLTCNVNFLKNINFSLNGYALEFVKSSTKYVTINEHVNAVTFTKRFSSIEILLNYTYYRKQLHDSVEIGVDVSDSELDNIKGHIMVLERNSESLYRFIIGEIVPLDCDKKVEITNISTFDMCVKFDIVLTTDEDVHTISCSQTMANGIMVELPMENHLHTRKLKYTAILLQIATKLNSYSGYFNRYIKLTLQLRKFNARISKKTIDSKIKQLDVNETVKNIYESLQYARENELMDSKRVDLTTFKGYKRYIILKGVMKNRRHCTLVVTAQRGVNQFEEYSLKVEKNQIIENATKFLNGYFV